METGSWLFPDGVDRERMLDMDRQLQTVRRAVFGVRYGYGPLHFRFVPRILGHAVAGTVDIPFGTPGSTNILRVAWVEE